MDQNQKNEDAALEAELAEYERRKTAREQDLERKTKRRRLADLRELDPILEQYGEANTDVLEMGYVDEETPILFAVKTPAPAAMKRYRDTCKQKKIDDPLTNNMTKAQEDLAAVTLIYPDKDTFAKMEQARPGIRSQAGFAASQLAIATKTGKA